MTDRAELISRVARLMGARVGEVGANTVTSAVLNGLVNTTGSNEAYKDWRLIFPVAPDEASKQTLIDSWVDLPGTATFATRAAFGASETYIALTRADYTLNEFREALATALRKSKPSYVKVMPTVPGERQYNLRDMGWLAGAGDVDAVYLTDSPNMLSNEDMGLWWNGPDEAPDDWVATGTVAQVEAGIRSPYAVSLVSGTLYQDIPLPLVQWITRRPNPDFTPIQDGVWVSNATAMRVGIYNGSTTTWNDPYTGTTPSFLTVEYTPTATDTALRLVVDGVGYVHAGVSMISNQAIPDAMQEYGSGAYTQYNSPLIPRNVGGSPVVQLQQFPGNQQLVVYCRRPFAEVTEDDDYIDDQYARVLEAGLCVHLLVNVKAGVDRSRYDRILAEQEPIWARFLENVTDLPVPLPQTVIEVVSA